MQALFVNSEESFPFPVHVESTRVSIDEVMQFSMRRHGSVNYLTVPILSHPIPQSGTRANVSRDLVHEV